MKRRGKRILWSLALVTMLGVATVGVLAYLALATPSWMRGLSILSPEQRTEAAQRAESRLLEAREYAAAAAAAERRDAGGSPTTAAGGRRVEFTQDEINALLAKWSEFRGWKQDYERFLSDPTVILRQDRVILAGRLVGYGDAVTSVHLRPEPGADGMVRLSLEQVVLGSLPVPQSMYNERFGSLAERVRRRLPDFQKHAEIDRDGMANASALVAGLGRLALDGLATGSAEAPLILPMLTEPGGVPVRVVDLRVERGKLVVDVATMNPAERERVEAFLRGDGG